MTGRGPTDTAPLVLVVDDDVTHRIIAREALEQAGFAVEEASDGAQAVEYCRRVIPDAVLLDVVMPEMDGYTVCREIRRLRDAKLTPILMITGLDDPESINHAYDAGATQFTIKPINWDIETHRVRYLVRAAAISVELSEREKQLMQAQKLEAVGLLTGGIAHDFNNVLMAVGGFAELGAKLAHEAPSLAEIFDKIKECSDRAVGLTRQLLKFSKQQASEPVVVDLRALTEEVSAMLRHLLGRGIGLSLVDSAEVATVLADATHLEQVLMNLAVNARDAMPDGGELTIETSNAILSEQYVLRHPDATAGANVVLTVTDTGCGMDEATQEEIFEPFFTTKGETGGTGLGLSTVYGIVRKYGGHVRIESELGKGTCFRICLPEKHVRPPTTARQIEREMPQGRHEVHAAAERPMPSCPSR